MRLLNIGFSNMVSSDRLIAVIAPDSAPVKRLIQEARDSGRLVDATAGRRTRAVVMMDSGQIFLSAVQPETIAGRLQNEEEEKSNERRTQGNADCDLRPLRDGKRHDL